MTTATTRRPRGKAKRADVVEAYARDVVAGQVLAGPWVRAACQRHLRDLERRDGAVRWDPTAAAHVLRFFEEFLRLVEGAHADQPFRLEPWQAFIVGSLFGWKGADGFRRFRV